MTLYKEGLTAALEAVEEAESLGLSSFSSRTVIAIEAYQTTLLQRIFQYIDGDKPYHRAERIFLLPNSSKASYDASAKDGKCYIQPFTLKELAEAILNEEYLKC